MMYTQVDERGYIVRSMYTANRDAAMPKGHRLLADPGYADLTYDPMSQMPRAVEPVPADASVIRYIAIPIPADALAQQLRETRNDLLAASDWTQLADAPLSTDAKAAWATYRQALRDLPKQPGFPTGHITPKAP